MGLFMKYQLLVVFYFLTSYSYATNFTTLPELAKYISLITTREDLTTLQASKHFESIKSKNNLLIDLNDDFKALNAILRNQKIKEKFFIVICHLGIKNIKIVNAENLKTDIINKFFQKFKEHSTSYSLRTISLVCNNLQIFPISISLFTECKS